MPTVNITGSPTGALNTVFLGQGAGVAPAFSAFTQILGGNFSTAAALAFSGAFASTLTFTAPTTVTFPTTGTLATTAGVINSITGTAGQISITASVNPVVSIDPTYVGQTSITTLGTIGTGTWAGTNIALNHGGTNAALVASNGGIFYSTATAGAILAGTATAQQLLLSGASTTPQWSTTTYPLTNAINTLLYASSANVMSALATANSGVLITSGAGVPSISSTLPSGITLVAPVLGTPASGTLTNTSGYGALRSFQILTSGSAATYTKPAGILNILVEAVGGGGAGAGGTSIAGQFGAGGGGGGGGYCRKFIAASAATYTYTIGAGGTAGAAGDNPGGNGAATTFSGGTLSAGGGIGGAGGFGSTLPPGKTDVATAGGVATGGDINISGHPATCACVFINGTIPGNGGSSVLGAGARGPATAQAAGIAALANSGGGGSGASSANAGGNTQAGAGGSGLIIVWEFG